MTIPYNRDCNSFKLSANALISDDLNNIIEQLHDKMIKKINNVA